MVRHGGDGMVVVHIVAADRKQRELAPMCAGSPSSVKALRKSGVSPGCI